VNFKLLIENNLKKLNLKRVRIKVDPSLVFQAEDLSQCDGYEGYILAETGDVPKVLVMSPDGISSVMDVPQQFLQMLMSDEEEQILTDFKVYVCKICELDTTTPEAELFLSASTMEEIESILKQTGLTDEELKVIYRNFIINSDNIVNESLFGDLLNKAKSTASNAGAATLRSAKNPTAWIKGASNVVKGAGKVYGALIGSKGGEAIQNLGSKLDSVYKSVKDRNINQAIKKLSRPPDGKDPVAGDKVVLQLPSVFGDNTVQGKITNVQGNYLTDKASLITISIIQPTTTKESKFLTIVNNILTEARNPLPVHYQDRAANRPQGGGRRPGELSQTPNAIKKRQARADAKNQQQLEPAEQAQPELPVDQIVITDTGDAYVKIKYFKNKQQIPDPTAISNKWPVAVGLHKTTTRTWMINTDTKDDKLQTFISEITATLARPDVKEKFKDITDQKIKQLSQATSKAAIKGILGLNDARFNELLGFWFQPNKNTSKPTVAQSVKTTPSK